MLAAVVLAAVMVGATACQRNGSAEPAPQAQPASEPTRVTVDQVSQWMNDDVPLVILDSRSEGGWQSASAKAEGAIRVHPHDVAAHISDIPQEGRIIVYCT